MDKPLHTFAAYKNTYDAWVIVPLIIAGICAFTIWYFNKKSNLDYTRRNIMVMLLSFFTIIALSTVGMKLYAYWRLQPVQIFNNRIVTPYGETPLSNVADFYVKLEKTYKPMQTEVVRDSARYFFLIEKNDKTHVLSEGDYPIYDILDKMNNVMGYK
jgi:hypothetical protein